MDQDLFTEIMNALGLDVSDEVIKRIAGVTEKYKDKEEN